jgi:Na+/phosphate symporter
MSSVLLRTLTRKSIIGFGNYKDLTVQNLIDLFKQKELLGIYYTCRNIDFCQDLKDELYITADREINKKIPQEERYKKEYFANIKKCLDDIFAHKTDGELRQAIILKAREKNLKKAHLKAQERALEKTVYGKIANRARNQSKL